MRLALKALAIGIFLVLGSSSAYSQCAGNPAAGRLCGNNTGAATLPGWQTMSSMLDRNFGAPSTQGTILNRGASLWSATSSPILGANGGNGGAVVLNGSSTGSATIGVKAAAGSVTFNLPITNGSVNQVLITDGAGNTSWTTAGAGTVSSVGLALPSSILTVSGSPVIGAGTLTGTLATQAANLVWAGPTTGSAATPTFRSLVGADLPNPSASTLGGIESFAAVGSQWIRQISTSGVPTASQPAFTDISGAVSAAQCVLPTVSTVGCVQAINAVTSNWVRSISTSGIPALSQPNFTDLAGNASLGQLPSISNNSVLGNNSGGTAVPSPLTASNVLDFIATTQGDVLYRNGSIWTALPPGTNGQVLTSGGAAANPSWTTVTGTGTVTSIVTNNGITGGNITTTGTIGLATITAGSVLANITGGSAIPIANTPSSILDLIGSATGDILYRSAGGGGWTVLAPGTNGQVLTQGATTPSWSNAGTLTNVTIAAGNGISVSGTCNITTTGTCTVASALGNSSVTGTNATYTSSQCFVNVERSNTGTVMVDALPGTGTGVLPAKCVVTITNSDSSAMLAIAAGSGAVIEVGAVNGFLYVGPGQTTQVQSDGSNYWPVNQKLLAKLGAATTIFVATTGSDTTANGLTSASAFATLNHAWTFAQQNFNLNCQTLTISHATGNYPQTIALSGPMVGQCGAATVIVQGNTGTPSNVTFPGTGSAVSMTVDMGAQLQLQGVDITSSGSQGLVVTNGSVVNFGSNIVGATSGAALTAVSGGILRFIGNYTINGNQGVAWNANNGGRIGVEAAGITVTLTGTPAFATTFAFAQTGGTIFFDFSLTFSGSGTGQRWGATGCGAISSGGTTFPGTIGGAVTGGCGQFS